MVVDTSVGHVATKDVPKLVLVCSSDMRVRWLVLEFDAVELGASDDALLLINRQSFPLSYLISGTIANESELDRSGHVESLATQAALPTASCSRRYQAACSVHTPGNPASIEAQLGWLRSMSQRAADHRTCITRSDFDGEVVDKPGGRRFANN